MKGKAKFTVVSVMLAAAVLIGVLSVSRAEAWVKITVKNNRSHNMSLAFRWDGFDADYHSRGWFTVNAGQTRTITLDEVTYGLTARDFGYYAIGGGSTWKGNNDNGIYGWFHPKEAFRLSTDNDGKVENPKSGMQRVLFRRLNLKHSGAANDSANGTASLTFNP
jgi:hypothetical protein